MRKIISYLVSVNPTIENKIVAVGVAHFELKWEIPMHIFETGFKWKITGSKQ